MLKIHWAHYPTDGWGPHLRRHGLQARTVWMLEWRRLWIWWTR